MTPGLRQTRVSIVGDAFYRNERPTHPGRWWRGHRIEGLLFNARLVQGLFDDLNPETVGRWAYPDSGRWDPERNTQEFITAMDAWRAHGLDAFTLNLQGGSPQGYSREQPWLNSAFEADGTLRLDYLARLERILDRADQLGLVVILGLFYFGQEPRLTGDSAILRGALAATQWVLEKGYTNVVLEANNECDLSAYQHPLSRPERVAELISALRAVRHAGRRLLAGTSFCGGAVPSDSVIAASDFVLFHGNGVAEPGRLAHLVRQIRARPAYRPMPVVCNEDDHFDFEQPDNNFIAAVGEYASWGYFDPGSSDYASGYQCPPVQWGINTPRKQAFFQLVREITGRADRID